MKEILVYISPVVVPAIGIVVTIAVYWFMALSELDQKPLLPYILLIGNYGLLVLCFFQTFAQVIKPFYEGSIIYLATAGPLIALGIGVHHFPKYALNFFHAWIVRLAFSFPVILGFFMLYLWLSR